MKVIANNIYCCGSPLEPTLTLWDNTVYATWTCPKCLQTISQRTGEIDLDRVDKELSREMTMTVWKSDYKLPGVVIRLLGMLKGNDIKLKKVRTSHLLVSGPRHRLQEIYSGTWGVKEVQA